MKEPLLPKRHPDQDMFICDFGDVIPKSDIASMEHPLFTLSTKPDTKIRHYEHNNNSVTIAPSAWGMATIHDKDILIYCISQLMAGINNGVTPSRKIRFKAHDLLVSTNRETSGDGYKRLKQAFERLAGTRIQTNIKTNDEEIIRGFGVIDSYEIVVKDKKTKRMVELEITISEWLYNSVLGQDVLSINRNYFRLRKPLERRIYELARKHCGNKAQWKIGLNLLHKKSGSSSSIEKFRFMLNQIIKHDHLPDYSVSIDEGMVLFHLKNPVKENDDLSNRPFLKPDTIEKAKRIIQRHKLDVYALEEEWLSFWRDTGEPELKSPDGAFINFCKNKLT
ncbi:MAG: replication initiator protein A [Gammaproteobacteria bacterium]|nr:replication initiator protein A [Gammaproteobacteria bacterium]